MSSPHRGSRPALFLQSTARRPRLFVLRHFLLLASSLVLLAFAGTPEHSAHVAAFRLQPTGDTLDVSPWIDELVHQWAQDRVSAYCVTSSHTWPAFYYLRHLSPADMNSPTPCATAVMPMFVQAGRCPDAVTLNSASPWGIVQCGPTQFRVYTRSSGQKTS